MNKTLCRPIALLSPLTLLACGTGNDAMEPAPAPLPDECIAEVGEESDCGYLAVEWDIEDAKLSCADVAADEVRIEITPAGASAREVSFLCEAGSGITLALASGPYSVRMHLVASEGGGRLASTMADTIILSGNDSVRMYSASFRVEDTAGRARYQSACSQVGAALCERLNQCGQACNAHSDFDNSCCSAGGGCDEVSPLQDAQVSSCAASLSEVSCGLIDQGFYDDLVDLSFCSAEAPATLNAADLGTTCNPNIACPAGYTCIKGEFSDLGFCSLPCSGENDTTTCSDSYAGPGVPVCGLPVSGVFFCGILCGQYNSGDQDCPGMLECEDGYDNDIEPDQCRPQ